MAESPVAATVHAVLLLCLPVATVAVCVLTGRKSGGRRSLIWLGSAAVVAYIATGFVDLTCTHLCDAGNPVRQTLLGGFCLWLVLVVPRFVWLRVVGAVLVMLATFGLSRQYVELVHTKGLTGNVTMRDGPADGAERMRSLVTASVKAAVPPATQPYPAGWLRDMPFASELGRLELSIKVETARFWHSWYTRLYYKRVAYQDFWFDGGLLPDQADAITLRDRDDPYEAHGGRARTASSPE